MAIIIVLVIIIYFIWKKKKAAVSTQTQPNTPKQSNSGSTPTSVYTPTSGGLPTSGFATSTSFASDPELINILNYSASDIAYLTVRQRINALNKLGIYNNQAAETAIMQAAQAGVLDKKQVSGAWVVPGMLLQLSITRFNNDPKIIAALANNTMYKPVLK